MKFYKSFLHVWITFMSVLTFLGGWAMLAHSRKPIQPAQFSRAVSIAPLPTLAPIQAFGSTNSNGGLTLFSPAPQVSSGFPLMRTGGS